MFNRDTAEKIISEVLAAMKDWRTLANRLDISTREMNMFGGVLNADIGKIKAIAVQHSVKLKGRSVGKIK